MKSFIKGFLISVGIILPVGLIFLIVWNLKGTQTKEPHNSAPPIVKETSDYEAIKDQSLNELVEKLRNQESSLIDDDVDNISSSDMPGNSEEENISEESDTSGRIELLFAGDLLFNDNSLSAYSKNGLSALFSPLLLDKMSSADYFILNEEFPFSNQGSAADKEWTFRIDPKHAHIIPEMGVDCVTVANNHALDYGTSAFVDTLDTLDGIELPHIGGGRTLDEAKAPVITEIHGKRIGFLAASRVIPDGGWAAGKSHPGMFTTYDPKPLCAEITALKETCDYVGVFIHWGIEKDTMPQEYQRSLAKNYIDAGADMVIGSHPHVLQGYEFYKGKPIAYSLGNYLFSNNSNPTVLYSIEIAPDGNLTPSIIPVTRVDGRMTERSDPAPSCATLQSLSFGVTISPEGIISEN